MAKIYNGNDADLDVLKGKRIAILGFGSQGHAHALNLRDSGLDVCVGLKRQSVRRPLAEKAGLPVFEIGEAVGCSQVIMLLVPDEFHGEVYRKQVGPVLEKGKTLLVAHGFSLLFQQISPPPEIDVALVAPKGPGHLVRREFTEGRGVPALLAVHQDDSGSAKDTALAYAKGIGATRSGVLETTIREETETDLFGEQAVLCGGVTSLMKAGYETLVDAGYQPEMAYFECINEMKLIVDLIYEGGFALMRHSISNTAEYGDYITQEKLITDQTRNTMKRILEDIRNGRFAREWIGENQTGQPSFRAMRRRETDHPLEEVGKRIRSMMPWLNNKWEGEP